MGALLLGTAVGDGRVEALCYLHDGADVDDAVGKVVDDARHVLEHEETVHVHAVAGKDADALVHVLVQVCEQLLLDLLPRLGRVDHLLREAGLAVVENAPLAHGVHRLLRRVDDGLVPLLVDEVQVLVCHKTADLDDGVVVVVQPGHLAVDPHNRLQRIALGVFHLLLRPSDDLRGAQLAVGLFRRRRRRRHCCRRSRLLLHRVLS